MTAIRGFVFPVVVEKEGLLDSKKPLLVEKNMRFHSRVLILKLILNPINDSDMKTSGIQTLIFSALFCTLSISLLAQPGGGPGGPGGFDPDEMIKREKQNVLKAVTDLTDDQKLLLDGIYDEFSLSFKELREEMMQTRDFQAMRPKMEALRKEKDDLMRDVLNDDQYNIYLGIVEERRRQMGNNRRANGATNQPNEQPQ